MVNKENPSPRQFSSYWQLEIGVNVIPVDSKVKIPLVPWKEWQKKGIPMDVHITWSQEGLYDSGIAIITGEISRGEYQGKHLTCIDIDNNIGLQRFLSLFKKIKTLEELSKITIVEQHDDAKEERAHIYFIVEKPLKKRSTVIVSNGLKNNTCRDSQIPRIEIKSDETTLVVCTPSIHKNGYPYRIIGTCQPAVLDRVQTEKFDKALDALFTEIDPANNNSDKVPIRKLFNTNYVVDEGNNRHEALLRVMESYIQRFNTILTEDEVKKYAQMWNTEHCVPPLSEKEFNKQWNSAKKYLIQDYKEAPNPVLESNNRKVKEQKIEEKVKSTSIEELLKSVYERCNQIFFDQFHVLYASIKVNGHFEVMSLQSRRFESIILSEYYEANRSILSKDKLLNITNLIKARAELDPNILIRYLNLRVAKYVFKGDAKEASYCYDLTNPEWQIIKVTSERWDIISDNDIPIFTRHTNSLPQTTPNQNYSKDVIEQFINLFNIYDHKKRLLLLVYIVSLFIPEIAKPILILRGSKGAAKTTAFELIKKIVDPSVVDTLFFPKEMGDLIQTIDHNYISFFDNIYSIREEISDILCRVVTGTGFSKRRLYTDDESISYNFKRPIGLNGINLASVKPDFLDRSLMIELERIPKEKRRKDEDVKTEFKDLLPDFLGWIFDTLVKVLGYKNENQDKINLKELPRMAEFAEYGEIISRCIGYVENEFINVYSENIKSQNEEVIESSVIAKIIVTFMEDKSRWEGSATELYSVLTNFAEDNNERLIRTKSWPNAANAMSRRINELASTLKDEGIDILHKYDNKRKSRIICMTNLEKLSLLSSYRSSDHELGKMKSEIDVSNFANSENKGQEGELESREKRIKIFKEQQYDNKNINKVINIHQIADRIHELSDIWMCKKCDHKGDKWDLLDHHSHCENNQK